MIKPLSSNSAIHPLTMKTCFLALLPLLLVQPLCAADLELASPFTDNAILQREMKVPVWGVGDTGFTNHRQLRRPGTQNHH
jgi:hypothetical protein